MIWPRLPVSVELGLMAMLFAVLIAAPLGILAALQQDGFLPHPKPGLVLNFWIFVLHFVKF